MSGPPVRSEFTYWFVLIEFILAVVLEFAVLAAFSTLILNFFKFLAHKNDKRFDFSPAMAVYILTEIFTAFFILLFLMYLLQGWTIQQTTYNGYLLFYLGALQTTLMTVRPITVFTLGVDRVLTILFPLKYQHERKLLPLLIACILSMTAVGLTVVPRIVQYAPTTSFTLCAAFGCMTSPSSDSLYINMRYATSAVNVLMGLALFVLFRIKVKTVASRNNRLVLYTICITFVLDLTPHIISAVFYAVENVNITKYVGPFSSVFTAFETILCAAFYVRSLRLLPCWSSKNINFSAITAAESVKRNKSGMIEVK